MHIISTACVSNLSSYEETRKLMTIKDEVELKARIYNVPCPVYENGKHYLVYSDGRKEENLHGTSISC